MNKKGSSELGIAPLRSLDDFLLESARFQVPNYRDLEKWGKRVVNNLLYYQTNYMLMSLMMFIIVGYVIVLIIGCNNMLIDFHFQRNPSCKNGKWNPGCYVIVLNILLLYKRKICCCSIQKRSSSTSYYNYSFWGILHSLYAGIITCIFSWYIVPVLR